MEKIENKKKKKNNLFASIKKAFGNISSEQKTDELNNRIKFTMSRKDWYIYSGMERKRKSYNRKTNKFKSNFISNRKNK